MEARLVGRGLQTGRWGTWQLVRQRHLWWMGDRRRAERDGRGRGGKRSGQGSGCGCATPPNRAGVAAAPVFMRNCLCLYVRVYK